MHHITEALACWFRSCSLPFLILFLFSWKLVPFVNQRAILKFSGREKGIDKRSGYLFYYLEQKYEMRVIYTYFWLLISFVKQKQVGWSQLRIYYNQYLLNEIWYPWCKRRTKSLYLLPSLSFRWTSTTFPLRIPEKKITYV